MMFLSSQIRDRCIKGDPVKPGTEFGISAERRIGLPQLYYYFLEKVLALESVLAI
jgi:hypothetical protein